MRFPGAYNPLCAKLIAEIGFDRVVKGNESSKITGVEDIKKEIAPLIVPPKIEDEPDFYMDYGSDTNYHTVTGKGECAA